MEFSRATYFMLIALFAVTGCVREEEALTGDPSNPIGPNPPPPTGLQLAAPADVEAEASGMMTTVALGDAVATGGDGSYTISHDGPAAGFPLGTTTVNWTVTDGSGATASATQSVSVADTTPPALTTPPDIQTVATGQMTMVDIGSASAVDLVDASPSVANDMPAAGFPQGTTGVMWTATDASGNTATAMQMITIAPMAPGPLSLTAPGAITSEATAPASAVTLGAAMAAGGQPPYTIVNDAPAGGFVVGSVTVTWTVTDGASMTATATQQVTITDTTAPTITAPADMTVDQPSGGGNATVDIGVATATDLADPSPSVSNNGPANGYPVGTTSVTWTATDASGNSAVALQQITVNAFAPEQCTDLATEFTNVIYPLMDSANPVTCNGCHTGPNPLPTANGFAFPNDPPTTADFDLFRTISLIDSGATSLVIAKARNTVTHGGGDRFPDGSNEPDFVIFEDFVNRARVCVTAPPTSNATIDLGTGYEQLYRTVQALGSRLPTTAEVNAVEAATDQAGIAAALDPVIDNLMTEDAFYTRVQEMYNDVLLTNRDADDRGNVDDNFDLDAFANRDYYEDNFSGGQRSDLREAANYGFARAPIELVKYVIENDRPFTEIVTADYVMVNPYSAKLYDDVGPNGFVYDPGSNPNADRDDFRPINDLRQSDGTAVPLAGIVGTHAFLGRYPSTNTNVNRARARFVFDYFLGIDIEGLAARDGLDLENVIGAVPTYEDPQCTVCHDVMDPIAGLFTKRDNGGEYDTNNNYRHTQTTQGVPRMVPAGYSLDPADALPSAEELTPLQWLGSRIAADDRFAQHTVRIVFEGLTGVTPTSASATFLNDVKNRFIASNYDFRSIVKDVVSSDFFLARNLAQGENPSAYPDTGPGRMLTPEELDRKIAAIAGSNYSWRGPNSNSGLLGRHYLLYGGIDSGEVITRTTEPNSMIDGIQERIANQVACDLVADHLYNDGLLFPTANVTDTPDTAAGETAIRSNIQHLHRHLLGEDLPGGNAELAATYQLFLDARAAGNTSIPSQCRGGGGSNDDNGTVLPWMAVVTYLLTDYRFLYN